MADKSDSKKGRRNAFDESKDEQLHFIADVEAWMKARNL